MTKENKYYVYGAYVDGVLKYVGKGTGNRYKHCMSGKSSCAELNRDFFGGKHITVELLYQNLAEDRALILERDMISENFEDLYNKQLSYAKDNYEKMVLQSYPFVTSIKSFTVDDREISFSSSDKAVYNLIFSNNPCCFSQEYIATLFGMSIKGVRDCLNKLQDIGIMEKSLSFSGTSHYIYTALNIKDLDITINYPDYSKELKTSRSGGATLSANVIFKIREF